MQHREKTETERCGTTPVVAGQRPISCFLCDSLRAQRLCVKINRKRTRVFLAFVRLIRFHNLSTDFSDAHTAHDRRGCTPKTSLRPRPPRLDCGGRRDGLAPLELVLVLPFLLFVMALMIDFGTRAAWKVRSQTNTRYAAVRTLMGRTGSFDPNPLTWPAPATLAAGGGSDVASVNNLWNAVPELQTPTIRGPQIVSPRGGRPIIVRRELEMSRGTHTGVTTFDRSFPLLERGIPARVSRRIDQQQELLDDRWQYQNQGFGNNRSRRAKSWYRIEPSDFAELTGLLTALQEADGKLKANPSARFLDPLDRDDEFIRYTGSAPNFYPRLRRACTDDPAAVQQLARTLITGGIQRLPRRMAGSFKGMYQREIDRLNKLDPKPPGTDQQIAALQQKIDQINRFIAALPRPY